MSRMSSITPQLISEYTIELPFREYLERKRAELEKANCLSTRHLDVKGGTKSLESSKTTATKRARDIKQEGNEDTNEPKREMVVYETEEPQMKIRRINFLCPFPRESWLTAKERSEYFEGFYRYTRRPLLDVEQQLSAIDCRMDESEQNQIALMEWSRFYRNLHQRVSKEQEEFLLYASAAAQKHPDLTSRFDNEEAGQYIDAVLERDAECRLAALPQHFAPAPGDPQISLMPHSDAAVVNLGWRREQEVLTLGQLPVLTIRMLDEKPYPVITAEPREVERRYPPKVAAQDPHRLSWKLPALSSDPVGRRLAEQHGADVLISASALVALLNNPWPHFSQPWLLPLRVDEGAGPGGRRLVVVDKPLRARRHVTGQERKLQFHRRVLEMQWLNYSAPSPVKQQQQQRGPGGKGSAGEEAAETAGPEAPSVGGVGAEEDVEDEISGDEGGLAIVEPPATFAEDDCPRSPDMEAENEQIETAVGGEAAHLTAIPRTIPLERVSESEGEPTSKTIDESHLHPDMKVSRRCWVYALWQFAGKRLLIRYSLHGVTRPVQKQPGDTKATKVPAYLQLKVENQPYFGCEVLTFRELWKSWVASLLRGRCEIVRVRVNFFHGAMIHLERDITSRMEQRYPGFNPKNGAHLVHDLLHRFDSLSAGTYLLLHEKGEAFCRVLRSVEASEVMDLTEDEKRNRNIFDLPGFVRQPPEQPLYSPWLPIDLRLHNIHHELNQTVPCLFNPPVVVKPSTARGGAGQSGGRGRGQGGARGRGRGRGGRGKKAKRQKGRGIDSSDKPQSS